MAITGVQLVMTLEGVTSNVLTSGGILYPQAIPGWLRAMKENILFHARNIGETMVLSIHADLDDTEDTVGSGALNVLGFVGQSTETAAMALILIDDQSWTPGGQITNYGMTYFKIGAATTPVQVGAVWFPYNTIPTELAVAGVASADLTTGAGTGLLKAWMVYAP